MKNETNDCDNEGNAATTETYPNIDQKNVYVFKNLRIFNDIGGLRVESKDVNALNFIANWYENEYNGRVKQNSQTCITLKDYLKLFKIMSYRTTHEYHYTMRIADKLGEIGYEMVTVDTTTTSYVAFGSFYFKAKIRVKQ